MTKMLMLQILKGKHTKTTEKQTARNGMLNHHMSESLPVCIPKTLG